MRGTGRLLITAALLVGCGKLPAAGNAIPLGAVIDRTGNNSEPSWSSAIRLAEKHANAGIGAVDKYQGIHFHFTLADSANTPSVAVGKALDLVKGQGVKALITDTSQVDVAIN